MVLTGDLVKISWLENHLNRGTPTLFLILGWGYQSERVQAGVYLLFILCWPLFPYCLLFCLFIIMFFVFVFIGW